MFASHAMKNSERHPVLRKLQASPDRLHQVPSKTITRIGPEKSARFRLSSAFINLKINMKVVDPMQKSERRPDGSNRNRRFYYRIRDVIENDHTERLFPKEEAVGFVHQYSASPRERSEALRGLQ